MTARGVAVALCLVARGLKAAARRHWRAGSVWGLGLAFRGSLRSPTPGVGLVGARVGRLGLCSKAALQKRALEHSACLGVSGSRQHVYVAVAACRRATTTTTACFRGCARRPYANPHAAGTDGAAGEVQPRLPRGRATNTRWRSRPSGLNRLVMTEEREAHSLRSTARGAMGDGRCAHRRVDRCAGRGRRAASRRRRADVAVRRRRRRGKGRPSGDRAGGGWEKEHVARLACTALCSARRSASASR